MEDKPMDIGNIIKEIHFANMLWLLLIPVAMMAIDIVTGLINAWATNSFQSARMRTGLAKKCGEIIIILIGMMFTYGMNLPKYILTGIAIYIIFMELMSVMENLKKLGVPIPAFISKVLNNVDETLKTAEDYEELKRQLEELKAAAAVRARDRPEALVDDGK